MLSNMLNPSEALRALKGEKLGQHVCVLALLVLVSASISGEMIEITTGLIGALVIYVMKERSSNRRTSVDKLHSSFDGTDNGSPHKKSKIVHPSTGPIHKIAPRMHHAEPRAQLRFANGLSMCEQVDQLIDDVLPGKEDTSVCEEFAKLASPCITKLIPEARIDVVAHSSVVRIGRTGLRPEIDLLVTVPPKVLAQRLLRHMRENAGDHSVRKLDKIMEVDENTLNKFAIRVVSAQLSFCKLWRTAYRGVEPKVVLLAPRCLGILSEDMHVHVYVNCPNIVRSKEVFSQSDKRVQKLIVFVRRWAQDRCIANTTYGHMPLYAWSLLVKNFCQSQKDLKSSTVESFGAFVHFYIKWHDSLSDTVVEAALQIADPYERLRNLADCMTHTGIKRFREELERAKTLLENESSLLTLVEHCNPLPHGRDVTNSESYKHQHTNEDVDDGCVEGASQDS